MAGHMKGVSAVHQGQALTTINFFKADRTLYLPSGLLTHIEVGVPKKWLDYILEGHIR